MMNASLTQILLPLALFSLMFGLGLSLRAIDFQRLLRRPALLLAGLVGQLILLPLLVFGLLQWAALPGGLALGLMIVALAPGGATSNLLSHLCRADLALSVSLTALSSLVVPLTLPLATALALNYWQASAQAAIELPVLATMAKLVTMALLPVLLGMLTRYRFEALACRLQPLVRRLALLFLLTVIVLLTLNSWSKLSLYLALLAPWVLLIACAAMAIGYALAYWAGGGVAARRTLAIEVGIQNAGTALLVTGTVLNNAEMSAAALLYGILMQLPALLLVLWCNRPAAAGATVGSVSAKP